MSSKQMAIAKILRLAPLAQDDKQVAAVYLSFIQRGSTQHFPTGNIALSRKKRKKGRSLRSGLGIHLLTYRITGSWRSA